MRDWEAQLRHGEKAYNYQNLTKNLPLKGRQGQAVHEYLVEQQQHLQNLRQNSH